MVRRILMTVRIHRAARVLSLLLYACALNGCLVGPDFKPPQMTGSAPAIALRRPSRPGGFSRLEPEAFRRIGAMISSPGGGVVLWMSIEG